MTKDEKAKVTALRESGNSYTMIANKLHLTVSAVKGFCQRSGVCFKENRTVVTTPLDDDRCRQCGKQIIQKPHTKKAIFCSKECRQKWWNSNLDKVNRKAIYDFHCACCGKKFTAYGNSHRKYCSHQCYINDRFNGGRTHA